MWKEAVWLGVPRAEIEKWNILEGDMTGRFACYRLEAEAPEQGKLTIDIGANARYRLWVNGCPVNSGPCKGDRYRQFYDTLELSGYLRPGKNVLAVQVLYCDPDEAVKQTDERASIFAVVSPGGGHRLAVEGDILDENGEKRGTVTTGKADWRVYLDGSFCLKSTKVTENLGAVCEEIDFRNTPSAWKETDFDSSGWAACTRIETVAIDHFMNTVGLVQRLPMMERQIPLLYERQETFVREVTGSAFSGTGILKKGEITVPAGEKQELILDAGVIKNGYPKFCFEGGEGAKVSVTFFEKFVKEGKILRRDDVENGEIEGITDQIILDGTGLAYEPFWVRTFRFVRISIEAGAEDVQVKAPVFRRTGYPLETGSWVKSSEKWVEEIWEMSLRTLENCMLETYMDCPYYEQMQFPMDTRLQAMFTYCVSTDARLAKKALEDYHCSMIPEGLIHGKYPSAYPQIISTFSLHYIYMLREYWMQTGDMGTVKKYFPDMDMILAFYDRKIGEDGLVGRLGYWEFVDWQPAWGECAGIPAALAKGPSSIINLMYACALECAAQLNEAAGRKGMAQEYLARQKAITDKVEETCWDEQRGMYREGPSFEQYTEHAQAWAVLNGMTDAEKSRRILRNAAEGRDVLKVTFSTSYEWFRALEQSGMYAYTEENMELWKGLLDLNCTTCPETPGDTRSDCHAWSALPIYEMIRSVAGICPDKAGWETVRICPHLDYLPDLEGEAAVPGGKIGFSYTKVTDSEKGEGWKVRICLPEGMKGILVLPDGGEISLAPGEEKDLNVY